MESYAIWPANEHLPLRVRLAIDTLVEKLPHVVGVEMPRVHPDRHAEPVTSHSPNSEAKRRTIQRNRNRVRLA